MPDFIRLVTEATRDHRWLMLTTIPAMKHMQIHATMKTNMVTLNIHIRERRLKFLSGKLSLSLHDRDQAS